MRNFTRVVFFLLAGLLPLASVRAHIVDWLENPSGLAPGNAMVFYYPRDFTGHFDVDPSYFEPCTVVVNVNNPSIPNPLINTQVLPPSTANSVSVLVQVLRAPSNHLETATITGEWHATGLPTGNGCDAVTPNPFSVPVSVTDQTPYLQVMRSTTPGWINLSGRYSALQFSSCLSGPWMNIGLGQVFSVRKTMGTGYFLQSKQMGGFVAGYVMDDSGWGLPNVTVGLLYGGPTATTDSSGLYSLPRMPLGFNLFSITNPIGASLNVGVTNKQSTSSNAYTPVMIKAAMVAAPLIAATNICNCTPWCAIGVATTPDGETPVYYSGGANSPNGGTPDCGQPQVTVTPPSGPPFSITPGSSHNHNSGPNPASGTWTVTAVVCGQTKTATITVP